MSDYSKPFVSGQPQNRDPRLSFYDAALWDNKFARDHAAEIQKVHEKGLYYGMARDTLKALDWANTFPGLLLEDGIDKGWKKAAAWIGSEWARPSHADFRFNNYELFRLPLSVMRGAELSMLSPEEMAKEHPALGDLAQKLGPIRAAQPVAYHGALATAYAGSQANEGYPWFRDNPKEARKLSANWINPLMLATPAFKLYSEAKTAANVSALEPHFRYLRTLTGRPGKFVQEASHLYGGDIIQPGFIGAVADLHKAGVDDNTMARVFHSLGYRAPEVPAHLRDVDLDTVRGALFRHPRQLISSTGVQALDAAAEAVIGAVQKGGRALLKPGAQYRSSVGDLSWEGVKGLERISDRIKDAYNEMGRTPEKLANRVHSVLQSVARVPPKVLADGTLDATPTLRSFEANVKAMQYAGTLTEQDPRVIARAGEIVKQHSLGWQPGTSWWSRIAPNPEFIKTGQLPPLPSTKGGTAYWHRPNAGYAKDVTADQLDKWAAMVKTREGRLEIVQELVGKADKVKGVVKQAYAEARTSGDVHAIDSMRESYKHANRIVRDLKAFRSPADPLAELATAEPHVIGRVIHGYDRILGVIRTAQLGNPGTQLMNMLDTNLIKPLMFQGKVSFDSVKEAITKGVPGELYSWLGEPVSKYADNDVAAKAFDVTPGGRSLFQKFGQKTGEVMTTLENAGRRELWWHAYNDGMKRLTDQGVSVTAADKLMVPEATRFTDMIQVNYNNLSSVEKGLRRAFMYPIFNGQDSLNYAKLFASHGTETALASKGLERFYEASADQEGRVRVGGSLVNPLVNLTPARRLLELAGAGAAVAQEDRLAVAAVKVARAVLGNETPAATALMALAEGTPEARGGSLSKWDNLIAPLAAEHLKVNAAPSDPLLQAMGYEPRDAREDREFKLAQLVVAAHARAGVVLSPDQARSRARTLSAAQAATSIVDGYGFLPMDSAEEGVMRDAARVNRAVSALPPEEQDWAKQHYLAQPGMGVLAPLIRPTPSESAAATSRELGIGASSRAGGEQVPEGGKSALMRFGDAAASLLTLASPASGEEFASPEASTTTWAGQGRKMPDLSALPQQGEKFRLSPTPSGDLAVTIDGARDNRNIEAGRVLNSTLKTALARSWSGGHYARVIDSYNNPVLPQMIRSAADADPYWGQVWSNYVAEKSNLQDGDYAEAPPSVRNARSSFFGYYRSALESAGPKAQAVAQRPLQAWQADVLKAAQAGRFPGYQIRTAGDAADFLDQSSLAIARARYDDYGGISRRWEAKLSTEYPEFGYWVGQLNDATRQPQRMGSVIEGARKAVAEGRLPGDAHPNGTFWQQLDDTPKYRNLFENIGVASTLGDARQVLDRVIVRDRSAKPVGVNFSALFEIGFDPKYSELVPYIQAARTNRYGSELGNAINKSIEQLPQRDREILEARFPVDDEAVVKWGRENGALAVGHYTPEFREILRAAEPPPPTDGKVPYSPFGPPKATQPAGLSPAQGSVPGDVGYGVLRTAPDVPPVKDLSQDMSGFFANRPGFRYNTPTQILTAAAEEYRRDTVAWDSYHGAVERGETPRNQDGTVQTPPVQPGSYPSYVGKYAGEQVAAGGTYADAQLAGQSIQMVNSAAQGVYSDLQKTGDVSGEGDGAAAMYGLNNFASTYSNPGGLLLNAATFGGYGLYVGIKSGLNFGGGGRSQAQQDNARINQERLDLQREQFNEQLRQQSIRDIRQRETDVLTQLRANPNTKPQVGEQLARFQRRGTFASKIGLVDALERELASALKPRF